MTVQKYFMPGTVIFVGTCSITGKQNSISATCSMAHAKALLVAAKLNGLTIADVAMMAGIRYTKALRLRAIRYNLRIAKQEVFAAIDRGFLPTISQLKRAGMY